MIFPASDQATEPVQPGKQPLDAPASSVAAQRTPILCGLTAWLPVWHYELLSGRHSSKSLHFQRSCNSGNHGIGLHDRVTCIGESNFIGAQFAGAAGQTTTERDVMPVTQQESCPCTTLAWVK